MIGVRIDDITVFFVTYFALLAGMNVSGLYASGVAVFIVALSITLLRWVYLHRDNLLDVIKGILEKPAVASSSISMTDDQWKASAVSTTGATIPLRPERIQDKWRDYYKREMFSGAHIPTIEGEEPLHVQDYVQQDNLGQAMVGEPISIRDRPDISNDAGCAWGQLETDMAPENYGSRKYAPDLLTAKRRCDMDEDCENIAHVRVNGDDTYTYGSGRLVERKDIKTDMITVSDHNAIRCFRNKK